MQCDGEPLSFLPIVAIVSAAPIGEAPCRVQGWRYDAILAVQTRDWNGAAGKPSPLNNGAGPQLYQP